MTINYGVFRAIRIYIFIGTIICGGLIPGCQLASLETSRQQVGSWGGNYPSSRGEALPAQPVMPEPEAPLARIEPVKGEKMPVSLPDPPVVSTTFDWLAKSDVSMRYGKWAEAIRTASAAIHHNPDSPKAYINRSFAYNQKELFKLALADANKAFLLDPLNVLALANRCYAKSHIDQLKEAKDDCLAAIDLAPDFSMPYNIIGFILEEEGRLREAELYFEMSCGLKNSAGCQSQQRLVPLLPKQ